MNSRYILMSFQNHHANTQCFFGNKRCMYERRGLLSMGRGWHPTHWGTFQIFFIFGAQNRILSAKKVRVRRIGCFGTICSVQLLRETDRTRKILTAVAVFLNTSPYKSTALFLISSFNPPLLPRRPTPKCVPIIFIRNWLCYFLACLLTYYYYYYY